MANVAQIFHDQWRFLTFRGMSPAVATRWRAYLAFGFVITWLAGIGRYWDHPSAHLWQRLGSGSLAYVFVLAAMIWLLLAPLKPKRWSYRNVLLFVTLTSAPALLYAIPVERLLPLGAATTANVWFLAFVAAWRVALYVWYLRRVAELSWLRVVVGALLPLSVIVTALSLLNLEHAVFEIMGGLRDNTANDGAYAVVILLAALSMLLSPVLLIAYVVLVARSYVGEH